MFRAEDGGRQGFGTGHNPFVNADLNCNFWFKYPFYWAFPKNILWTLSPKRRLTRIYFLEGNQIGAIMILVEEHALFVNLEWG